MLRKTVLAVLLLFSTVVGANAEVPLQAEGCTPGFYCVEFDGQTLELSRKDGDYQWFVTQKDTDKTERLSGETVKRSVTLTGFFFNGESFVEDVTLPPLPQEGALRDAEVGDTFTFIEDND